VKIRALDAGDTEGLARVWRLTHAQYVCRGYCEPQPDGLLRHYPALDGIPETTVLIAEEGAELKGTVTLTLDGPRGLHTDHAFPRETSKVRGMALAAHEVLASSWRIVTACRKRRVVFDLISAVVGEMEQQGVDICLFTFHPRHRRFYQRSGNLEVIAECENDPSVHGNPAILMLGYPDEIKRAWKG